MLGAILEALVPSRGMYDQMDDPSNRAPWSDFWYTPLGIPEIAGAPTANGQLFVSGCFAATRLLCGIGATSPLNLMRKRTVNGRLRREIQDDHPVHKLLNVRPNEDQTPIAWKSQGIGWQVNWGTGFSEIQTDQYTGSPCGLHSIHPKRMRPFRDSDRHLWWHVTQPNGQTEDLKDSEIIRMPYIVSEDGGITGLGVAYQAMKSIGLSLTMERAETQASKAGVPRIVVEAPKPMQLDQRTAFRREWNELYEQGGESVALLTEGAAAKPLDWKMTDQQHTERRQFLIEEMARWYDVPQVMLRRAIKELAGNVEQQGIDFKTYSLRFLDVWLQELAYKLLTPDEISAGFYFAFDFADLLRGDLKALSEYYRSMNAIGVYSANDILDRLGENPHDKGDEYFVQGAMRPIDEPYSTGTTPKAAAEPDGDEEDDEPADAEDMADESSEQGEETPGEQPNDKTKQQVAKAAKAVQIMLTSTLERFANKEAKAVSTAASKPREFTDFLESFYSHHQSQMEEALGPICEAGTELGMVISAYSVAGGWCVDSKSALVAITDTATMTTLSDEVASTVTAWPERVGGCVATYTTIAG